VTAVKLLIPRRREVLKRSVRKSDKFENHACRLSLCHLWGESGMLFSLRIAGGIVMHVTATF
jgi:hypothetical protein